MVCDLQGYLYDKIKLDYFHDLCYMLYTDKTYPWKIKSLQVIKYQDI